MSAAAAIGDSPEPVHKRSIQLRDCSQVCRRRKLHFMRENTQYSPRDVWQERAPGIRGGRGISWLPRRRDLSKPHTHTDTLPLLLLHHSSKCLAASLIMMAHYPYSGGKPPHITPRQTERPQWISDREFHRELVREFRCRRIRDHVNNRMVPISETAPNPSVLKRAPGIGNCQESAVREFVAAGISRLRCLKPFRI